jgi:hypothetical protein
VRDHNARDLLALLQTLLLLLDMFLRHSRDAGRAGSRGGKDETGHSLGP